MKGCMMALLYTRALVWMGGCVRFSQRYAIIWGPGPGPSDQRYYLRPAGSLVCTTRYDVLETYSIIALSNAGIKSDTL